MESIDLKKYEPIFQEQNGNLIKSTRWNDNFNRIEKVVRLNNDILKQNFDNIISQNIPSTPIKELSQTEEETNILEQLILLAKLIIKKLDIEEFEDINAANISDISFNFEDGIFTFTKNDGTVLSCDFVAGTAFTHEWNGTVLTVTSASGTNSADLKGDKGDIGRAFTYDDFTPEQLAKLKGEKGNPGYTPVKNKDYFDGKDGYSGVHVGSDMPPESANVWIYPDGEPFQAERWEFVLKDGTEIYRNVWVFYDETPDGAEEWEFVLKDKTVLVKKVVCM